MKSTCETCGRIRKHTFFLTVPTLDGGTRMAASCESCFRAFTGHEGMTIAQAIKQQRANERYDTAENNPVRFKHRY